MLRLVFTLCMFFSFDSVRLIFVLLLILLIYFTNTVIFPLAHFNPEIVYDFAFKMI